MDTSGYSLLTGASNDISDDFNVMAIPNLFRVAFFCPLKKLHFIHETAGAAVTKGSANRDKIIS
jgi:hypothetical protein